MANSECLNIVLLVRMLEVKETKAGRLRMTNYFWRKGILTKYVSEHLGEFSHNNSQVLLCTFFLEISKVYFSLKK